MDRRARQKAKEIAANPLAGDDYPDKIDMNYRKPQYNKYNLQQFKALNGGIQVYSDQDIVDNLNAIKFYKYYDEIDKQPAVLSRTPLQPPHSEVDK